MSGHVRRLYEGRLRPVTDPTLIALFLSFSVAFLVFHFSAVAAFSAQTKEECQKCCETKGLDEYYLDQCKLKCFRNPDHCTKGSAAVKRTKPRRSVKRKPRRKRSAFRWPNPLNLTPGNEWEAAAQILSMNGITPQHPNAAPALQAVEMLLKEFVQTSPQGGTMPTTQIQRIIKRYR